MNFPDAIMSCFKKFASGSGRASRSEFWFWVLFTFIVSFVTQIIDIKILHVDMNDRHAFSPVHTISQLILLLPSLAVTVRRLHDVDRPGPWIFIAFTIIGAFFPLLYWECTRGTTGTNRFGNDPLA